MASSEESYYFCHVCSCTRSETEISPSDNGDLRCLICNNEGFVEKVSAPPDSRRSYTFHRFATPYSGPNYTLVNRYASGGNTGEPSTLGDAQWSNFVRNLVAGGVNSAMQNRTYTIRGTMGVRGNAQMMRASTGEEPSTGAAATPGPTETFDETAQRLFSAFMQNPFDPRAMNEIMYYMMENDPNRQGPPPAAKRVVESLEVETIDEETAKRLETCAICTEDFAAGDRIHWLSNDRSLCGHGFHVDCILPWLRQHNSCPVCRYELPTDDEQYNLQRAQLRSRLVEEVQRHVDPNSQPNSGRQSFSESGQTGSPAPVETVADNDSTASPADAASTANPGPSAPAEAATTGTSNNPRTSSQRRQASGGRLIIETNNCRVQ